MFGTSTRTYALLEVSQAAYDEITGKLKEADQEDRVDEHEGRDIIDMYGIALCVEKASATDVDHPHLIGGEFQSDKYPTCPRGKVPLSVKDPTAQSLLWEYAQRRRPVDAEFADDLELALKVAGYEPESK